MLHVLVCLVQIAVLVKFQLQARTVRETCVRLTAQLSFQAAMIMYQLIAVDAKLLVQFATNVYIRQAWHDTCEVTWETSCSHVICANLNLVTGTNCMLMNAVMQQSMNLHVQLQNGIFSCNMCETWILKMPFQQQTQTVTATYVYLRVQLNFQATTIMYQLIAVDTSLLVLTIIIR